MFEASGDRQRLLLLFHSNRSPSSTQCQKHTIMKDQLLFYAIALLLGFIIGYVTKDITTIEKKITVNVRKQKIKGEGNQLDSDFDIDINETKERFKLFNRKKKKA